MLNYVHWFFKIRIVSRTLYLWNQVDDSQFFVAFLTQVHVTHYMTTIKILRKIYWLENFRTNGLNPEESEYGFCFFLLNTEINPRSYGSWCFNGTEESTLDSFPYKNPILDLFKARTLSCWCTPSVIKNRNWFHHRRLFYHPVELGVPKYQTRRLTDWRTFEWKSKNQTSSR